MNISQEQKIDLKISSISENEITFKFTNTNLEIYNYKDGDFSIKLEDRHGYDVEVILNEKQIKVIQKFLNNEL